MILDKFLQLSVDQAASGNSTNTVDFGQKTPNLGLNTQPLYVVVACKNGWASGDTLTVEIEHSDQETTGFTTVSSSGARPVSVGTLLNIPMPMEHKRYVRLKYTKTGTGGNVDAHIVAGLQANTPPADSPRIR